MIGIRASGLERVFLPWIPVPSETVELVREWAALSASIAGGLLLVFLAVRSPRNIFALLLAATVSCTVGLAFLPALHFHLALQLGRRRVRPWLLDLGDGLAGALALTLQGASRPAGGTLREQRGAFERARVEELQKKLSRCGIR